MGPVISDEWLELSFLASRGGRGWIAALRAAKSPGAVLAMDRTTLRRFGVGDDAPIERCPRETRDRWRAWLGQPGHDLVVCDSELYPEKLAEMADAPLALWVDGSQPSLLCCPQLALVGSRHPTRNGIVIAESFAARLSESGITITSGLARGIDAAGHRGALSGPGSTIAVLGNGIDHVYPAANRKLAEQIRESGLIVSEYGPATPVRPFQFPRRNRIIAALGLGTLVVEATRRSGSLITARLAAEYGREVFSVPGSIHSALSKGCHKLIRDGAKLVEDVGDILVEIAPQLRALTGDEQRGNASNRHDDFPSKLAPCLDFSPVSLDALVNCTGLTAAELSSMLLHLEIQGKIEALPGGRYCRLAKRA